MGKGWTILALLIVLIGSGLGVGSSVAQRPAHQVGELTRAFGLRAHVTAVTDAGEISGIMLDETTCLGDLRAQGRIQNLPRLDLPKLPGQTHAANGMGRCGILPTRPVQANVAPREEVQPSLQAPFDQLMPPDQPAPPDPTDEGGVVRAAQTVDQPNAQYWQQTGTGIGTSRTLFGIGVNLQGQQFNVSGDYFQYVWAGGALWNQQMAIIEGIGYGDAFYQAGVFQGGPQVDTVPAGSAQTLSFATQYHQYGSRPIWYPLSLETARAPSLTNWNWVMTGVGPDGTGVDFAYGIASNDGGNSFFFLPNMMSQIFGPNITRIVKAESATEQVNSGSGLRPPINYVYGFGPISIGDPGGSVTVDIQMLAGNGKSVTAPGATCPPLDRVAVTNQWLDFSSLGYACPNGPLW